MRLSSPGVSTLIFLSFRSGRDRRGLDGPPFVPQSGGLHRLRLKRQRRSPATAGLAVTRAGEGAGMASGKDAQDAREDEKEKEEMSC